MSVDLPAPFSPTRAWDLAAPERERDVVESLHAREGLADAPRLEGQPLLVLVGHLNALFAVPDLVATWLAQTVLRMSRPSSSST